MPEPMVKLAIDFENPSKSWWESGGRDLWEALTEAFDGSTVIVEESIATSWLEQAASIPGWEGGPDHAPHPICQKSINEDEEY